MTTINDIEVHEYENLSINHKNNSKMSTTIKLSELNEEQKIALLKELRSSKKEEKLKRKDDINAYKELSSEFVNRNIDELVRQKSSIEDFIGYLFKDYKAVKALKENIYGVKPQDSHTSTLADGSASITIGYNVTIGFDGTETAGVQKIKSFMESLKSDDENSQKLSKIANTFLKPNAKTGMLNPSKIIELDKLRDDFLSEEFDEGMDIIFSAQNRHQNSMYVSGWKFIKLESGINKKMEFRFTV